MAYRNRPRIGDRVLVRFGDRGTNNPAYKFDNQEFIVKHIHLAKRGTQVKAVMYNLYGADSEAGLPYWFLDDDLIVL